MSKKNKVNLLTISLLLFIFASSTTTVFAATKLDLSAKKIISKNGDYYFKIPVSWESYIYAEREESEGYAYFDKINFYYEPRDIGNKAVKFLTLYTYYADDYTGYTGQKKILTTDKYVFTTSSISVNPYESVNDRIIFSRFLTETGTPDFISGKIYISANKDNEVQKGTLTVNGYIIDNKPQFSNGELFLPLRATSEKLGYTVTWNANKKEIYLKRGNSVVTVPISGKYLQYRVINKKGTVFMPVTFFIQKLGVSVDVDSNDNVKIKG